jgi:hypothetical protein
MGQGSLPLRERNKSMALINPFSNSTWESQQGLRHSSLTQNEWSRTKTWQRLHLETATMNPSRNSKVFSKPDLKSNLQVRSLHSQDTRISAHELVWIFS